MNLILVVGHTGQGKTPWVSKAMRNGYKPNPNNANKCVQIVSNDSLRQYVFDINNEYLYPEDSGEVKPQMRNIDGDVKKFLDTCKNLKKTNIIFEDATGFFRGKQSAQLIRLIVAKMHSGNNFILLFHSVNRVPPELMELANLLVLFRTVDNLETVEKKFKNKTINAAMQRLIENKKINHLLIKLL
jgi:ABC-type sugar transport system ATPase subunit